jgi:hypothetical protein
VPEVTAAVHDFRHTCRHGMANTMAPWVSSAG